MPFMRMTMKESDVMAFEKIELQLLHLRSEMDSLSKKSPNDPINKFKLRLINDVLEPMTDILGAQYAPIRDFRSFDPESLPTNSDVLVVMSQYQAGVDKMRQDQTGYDRGRLVWLIDDKPSEIVTKRIVRLSKE